MFRELTPIEQASKAYPDLFDRYLNMIYGYIPEHVILTQAQADEFISLSKLEDELPVI